MKSNSFTRLSLLLFAGLGLIISCSRAEKGRYDNYSSSKSKESINLTPPSSSMGAMSNGTTDEKKSNAGDSINGYISSTAATNAGDSNRKFVKTADLRFKVKTVIKSTIAIEEIIKHFGGFVTSSNLTSNVDRTENTSISADSSLETTYYTVSNTMVLRIPEKKLDTTLKTIALQIDYLDYRNITAEDVQFDLLNNRLAEIRLEKQQRRITKDIDDQGKKLKETTSAEELLADKEDAEDNARIQNMMIKDKIDFSTINIQIYQRESLKRELIANEQNIKAYKPSFGSELRDALISGWTILKAIFVFFVNIWFLYVIAIVGYILFKVFAGRGKK
jgi:hypothetical protein